MVESVGHSSSEKAVGERVSVPKVGDVIVCAAFANGWRQYDKPDVDPDGPIWVTDAPETPGTSEHVQECRDEWRGTTKFVVEESGQRPSVCVTWKKHCRGGGYGDPFEWEEEKREYAQCVSARRLADDGSYDPDGEAIQFRLYFKYEAVREVKGSQGRWIRSEVILETPIYKVGTMRRTVTFV